MESKDLALVGLAGVVGLVILRSLPSWPGFPGFPGFPGLAGDVAIGAATTAKQVGQAAAVTVRVARPVLQVSKPVINVARPVVKPLAGTVRIGARATTTAAKLTPAAPAVIAAETALKGATRGGALVVRVSKPALKVASKAVIPITIADAVVTPFELATGRDVPILGYGTEYLSALEGAQQKRLADPQPLHPITNRILSYGMARGLLTGAPRAGGPIY